MSALRISVSGEGASFYNSFQQMATLLPRVVVKVSIIFCVQFVLAGPIVLNLYDYRQIQGIPTVNRAVINEIGNAKYNLLVEGYDFQRVMTTDGVAGCRTRSNHIPEVCQVLGIEAAR